MTITAVPKSNSIFNMEILAKYIHGSADSTDTDVLYIVAEQMTFADAKAFCDADKTENRNVATVVNGTIEWCYKGTPDELNNSLFETYSLHEQKNPLLVKYRLHRDVFLKCLRAVRIILSHLSRTQYRPEIKSALKGGWDERLEVLGNIDISSIDFSTANKNMTAEDTKKILAFQIGQTLALMNGVELYTKAAISEYCPGLRKYLYREDTNDTETLQWYLNRFLIRLLSISAGDDDDNHVEAKSIKLYDILKEKQINKFIEI